MHDFMNDVAVLSQEELRQKWSEYWQLSPPPKISRTMLEKSLAFKLREHAGLGLTTEQQKKLNELVRAHKRSPTQIKEVNIKIGTRLVRTWKGHRHSVIVKDGCFEYQGKIFKSLSEIAATITGTRWNGWVFFGLKKSVTKKDAA